MIYFITENYLKTQTVLTDNVDVTDFAPLVQFAAKAFVKPAIGSYFFDDLLTKYNAKTLSADETLVVEKMQPAIAWRALAHSVITLTYQLKNKGIQKQNDDNAEAVELKEVTFLYDHYVQQAILFQTELKTYLNDNKDSYPNYTSTLNKDSSFKSECCNKPNNFQEGIGMMII